MVIVDVIKRFRRVYLGDSLLRRIELDLQANVCTFIFDTALFLKDSSQPSIFDPEEQYTPARLDLMGVTSMSCPDGEYFLNSTVVDLNVRLSNRADLAEFTFTMTGGVDNETFMRSLRVTAKDFFLTALD